MYQSSLLTTTMRRSATNFLLLLLAATTFILSSRPIHALWQPNRPDGGITASCILQERNALLEFKRGITSDPAGELASWKQDQEDCCRWRGVRCSNTTGRILELRLRNTHADLFGNPITPLTGQISQSLLALERLEYLDLSLNQLQGTIGRIPEFMGSLKNLKYLNLSGIMFSNKVPPQLGNLSNLQYLDISNMNDIYSTDVSWLTNLSILQYLSLDSVELQIKDDWPLVLNMLPSLRVIFLSNCRLSSANHSLGALNLTNLEELDLSLNYFSHPLASCWFWNITCLTYLDLGSNYWLYGELPNQLEGMTMLRYLSLSYIKISLSMAMARLNSLCNLRILYLDGCFLQGSIVDLIEMLPQCSSNKLQQLSLESNQLTGTLPNSMGQLTNLVVLDLSRNNITGPVPEFIRNMTSLVLLDLSGNKMEGTIPKFIGELTSLSTLDLSHNQLSGPVPYEIGKLQNMIMLSLSNNDLGGMIDENHFANIRSLYYIDLSYNSLKIELSSDWRPPFRLGVVHFASCQMGLFPAWLQWQVDIIEIDISNTGIIDRFPHWFCSALPNLLYLNISHNQLNGDLPMHMGNMSLEEVYLSSNLLTGQVPPLPINLTHLDISMNSLSGPLPSNFGSPNLIELSLFSNHITGGIPRSLICECEELEILDLANNDFEGDVPNCVGNIPIRNIELSNNSLSGEFPSFLENCTELQFLDLAGNKFSGRLPPWIGNLARLQFLRLSHNRFSGNISINLTNLVCLKYLDISGNSISGPLSRHVWNLRSMRQQKHWEGRPNTCLYSEPIEYHSVSLYAIVKGQQRDYGSSSRIMDVNTIYLNLSSNYLTGLIPEELASLDVLRILNLSRNNFTGNIPRSVGAMQLLESLDLSRNELSGEIPESLSKMTFLSYLDMSCNNLSGRIPSGSQLDTLYAANPSMYSENMGLCGPPLKKNCPGTDASKHDHITRTEQDHGPEFFYLGLGCGIIAGLWVVFCTLLLKKRWRITYFRLSDKMYDKLYSFICKL